METLQLRIPRRPPVAAARRRRIVGVVGSGNLEVLVEPTASAAPAGSRSRPRRVGFGADLAGGAGRLLRAPSAGGRAHLHQRRAAPRPPWSACGWTRRCEMPITGAPATTTRSYYEAQRPRTPRAVCSTPAAFVEFLPPTERVVSPHLRQLDAAGGVRRRHRRRPRHAGRRRRSSSPRRKAASWAAPSARCTAPSWSACCERALRRAAGRRPAAGRVRRRAPARGQCRPDRRLRDDARRAGGRAPPASPSSCSIGGAVRLLRRHGHRRRAVPTPS